MSASRMAVIGTALLLACCSHSPKNKEQTQSRSSPPPAATEAAAPTTGLVAFADPGEDAPISGIAIDAATYHLVAVSRKGRKIGATYLPSGLWPWKYKLAQEPGLVAVHPVSGEGFLIWQTEGRSELVRFRAPTGETLARVDLGPIPAGQFQAAAFDTERQRLYLAAAQGILCVDLGSNQLLAARPGALLLPFVQPLDLAVDAQHELAVIPHGGGGITLLDLAAWGSYGVQTPATEIQLEAPHAKTPSGAVVDSERGRAYVLDGREWVEIDLAKRQIDRWIAFQPERDFAGGRLALAPSCRRLYLACGDLVEVNLDKGQWESIVGVGQCPVPVVHAGALGMLFTVQNGQIYSSQHRCGPGEAP